MNRVKVGKKTKSRERNDRWLENKTKQDSAELFTRVQHQVSTEQRWKRQEETREKQFWGVKDNKERPKDENERKSNAAEDERGRETRIST